MAYGIKVWDSSGNVTLDVTDRLTREYGTGSVSWIEFQETNTITIPGITNDGTWFIKIGSVVSNINSTTGVVTLTRTAWPAVYLAYTEFYTVYRG